MVYCRPVVSNQTHNMPSFLGDPIALHVDYTRVTGVPYCLSCAFIGAFNEVTDYDSALK